MYPAGALTPVFGNGAETAGGNVDAGTEGSDVRELGGTCDNKMPGSKDIASRFGNHRQRAPTRRRFKPSLKSNRRPNADLIIIETERIERTAVLAVQVIGADIEESGD
jgi:hypothetical protein